MKKILPYILMFTVIANILAPFSIVQPEIKKVYAEDAKDIRTICSSIKDLCALVASPVLVSGIDKDSQKPFTGGTLYVAAAAKADFLENGFDDDLQLLIALRFKDVNKSVVKTYANSNNTLNLIEYDTEIQGVSFKAYNTTFAFKDLLPNTTYTAELIVRGVGQDVYKNLGNTSTLEKRLDEYITTDNGKKYTDVKETDPFTTPNIGERKTGDETGVGLDISRDSYSKLPPCGLESLMGCVAQGLYYVLFVPTSYIFAFSGMFFDFMFGYSVNDTSYRKQFVVEGWALVRDFCNMFFIFVLLYVAFATILDLHHFDTKGMIVNVVIIGVLINFSLFAAQFIIDTSNILARVFYNSQAISIQGDAVAVGTNGSNLYTADQNGNLPLSAALVNKVDPQNLIINANKINDIRETGKGVDMTNESGGLGIGTFILVTLLATAVNIVGFVTFLNIGLIFVARVIGLYFSMILAPLAFFSYTVPKLAGMKMIGFKSWWSDLTSMAFLAPIFMFFMYLILGFLDKGLSLVDTNGLTGIDWVVATIIPFAFVMIMLLTAKSVAKDFSGTVGQTVTGAVAAVGGAALGGAALGTAALGRGTLGSVMRFAQNSDARGDALKFKETGAAWKNAKGSINPLKYIGVAGTAIKGAGQAVGAITGAGISKIGVKNGKSWVERQSDKVENIDGARHEIDEIKSKAGFKNIDLSRLTSKEEEKVKDEYFRAKRSDTENKIRKDPVDGEDGFKKNRTNRNQAEADYIANQASMGRVISNNNFDDKDKKAIENQLQLNFNAHLKLKTDNKLENDFKHTIDESKKQVSPISRIVTASATGNYDLRSLSSIKQADDRDSDFAKASTFITSTIIGSGMRAALKNVAPKGVNYGTGQNDFMKDLKNTLSDALKSVNVKVSLSGGGNDDR